MAGDTKKPKTALRLPVKAVPQYGKCGEGVYDEN